MAFRASSLFELIPIDTIKHKFLDICKNSNEQSALETQTTSVSQHGTDISNPSPVKSPALDQYTINLTEKAKKGQIDPVIGREFEIRLMLDILMRRRQNNPILTGEPGVGKTAVVEV
jgi:type VI secretion system protein VasG